MVVALVSGQREELGGPDTDAEAAARVTLLPATGQPEVTHLFTGECSKINPPPPQPPPLSPLTQVTSRAIMHKILLPSLRSVAAAVSFDLFKANV